MSKQGLGQQQQLAQKQITSQQTVQLMKMIELSNVALEEEILKTVDENPALDIKYDDIEDDFTNHTENSDNDNADDIAIEVDRNDNEDPFDNDFFGNDEKDDDIPAYRLYANNYSEDVQQQDKIIAFDHSLQEQLSLQLSEMALDDRALEIGKYIIGNIDDNGYLTRESLAISNELLFSYNIKTSPDEIEHIITHYIQELDPAGIGARNLQECLLLQLKRKDNSPASLVAREIISKHFDSFSKKYFDK
ncbi:MAG: RNA polymerase sigma-54 factor, partial [Bacteroidales bacterium]|nr:RNA polymerase sigma-54 factor [Bacteroidales bacterium]